MERDPRGLLYDIGESCRNILYFTSGLDLAGYTADLLVRSAVERQFIVIGEALNRLKHVDKEIYDRFQEAGKIIGFRNILVHGYEMVSDELVWDVIGKQLNELAIICERELRNLGQ